METLFITVFSDAEVTSLLNKGYEYKGVVQVEEYTFCNTRNYIAKTGSYNGFVLIKHNRLSILKYFINFITKLKGHK